MKKFRSQKKPESVLQEKIRDLLKIHDWAVFNTHGTMYSSGLPDIYCCHTRYGARWIEVKIPDQYSFTPAQLDVFPMFSAKGVGIWILTAATEKQYKLIFGPSNWHMFLSIMKQGNFQ